MVRVSIIAFLLALCAACTKTVYVPVERKTEVKVQVRDTMVVTKIEKETVVVNVQDTVAVAETRYATARAEIARNKLNLTLRNKSDSTLLVPVKTITTTIRDSIPYPVEVIREKKVRYVAWYDKLIRWVGIPSFLLVLFIIIFKLAKWQSGWRL